MDTHWQQHAAVVLLAWRLYRCSAEAQAAALTFLAMAMVY